MAPRHLLVAPLLLLLLLLAPSATATIVSFPGPPYTADMILRLSQCCTMVGAERLRTTIVLIELLVKAIKVPGAIVEAGVYKGGSAITMILALEHYGDTGREVHLYDTFEGMTPPTAVDIGPGNVTAQAMLDSGHPLVVARAELDLVRRNIYTRTKYPRHLIHFHKGDIVQTREENIPATIALLRLDTDWYESTKWELERMYPRVVPGGIVVVDDYGAWWGCKQAVDEFVASHLEIGPYYRIDDTGLYFQKPYAPQPQPEAPLPSPDGQAAMASGAAAGK